MKAEKTLDNTNVLDAEASAGDLQVYGNGDLWKLLCKASSQCEGWMKSTKVMEICTVGEYGSVQGCLVQVTTQQGEHVAEAITYIPGVKISDCGKKLVRN